MNEIEINPLYIDIGVPALAAGLLLGALIGWLIARRISRVLGDEAPRRIDWIITRGFEVIGGGVHPAGESDHPCYWAELRLASITDE